MIFFARAIRVCSLRHNHKPGGYPKIYPVQDKEKQDKCAKQPHAAAVPFAAAAAVAYSVPGATFAAVAYFQCKALDDVNKDKNKKPYLNYTYHNHGTHEACGFIKHFAAVVCPNTGVKPHVYS